MAINPSQDVLAQHIHRLMISSSERQRLIEELKALDEGRRLQLSALLQEHDQEALKVLDEKAGEIEEMKVRLTEGWPKEQGTDDLKNTALQLKDILNNPEKLAQLIAASDDMTLKKLEEVIEGGLEHNPQVLKECQQFFTEVRLQKAAFIKEGEQEQKRLLQEALISRKEQNDQLDVLIGKAKDLLQKD